MLFQSVYLSSRHRCPDIGGPDNRGLTVSIKIGSGIVYTLYSFLPQAHSLNSFYYCLGKLQKLSLLIHHKSPCISEMYLWCITNISMMMLNDSAVMYNQLQPTESCRCQKQVECVNHTRPYSHGALIAIASNIVPLCKLGCGSMRLWIDHCYKK